MGDFPFSSLFAQLLGFSFGFGPTSHVGRLKVSILHSDRTGLKELLIKGPWLTQAVGGGGVQNGEQACGGRGQHDVATA